MQALAKKYIPIGYSGGVLIPDDSLSDHMSVSDLSSKIAHYRRENCRNIILFPSSISSTKIDSILSAVEKADIHAYIYRQQEHEHAKHKVEVDLIESILQKAKLGNFIALYQNSSEAILAGLVAKILVFSDKDANIADLYANYFPDLKYDSKNIAEFKNFLDNDFYLIKKSDKKFFEKIDSLATRPEIIALNRHKPVKTAETNPLNLNLSSLGTVDTNYVPISERTEPITFNLSSINFEIALPDEEEEVESLEDALTQPKTPAIETEQIKLDINLSDEIHYLSSILPDDDDTIIDIETLPLEEEEPVKVPEEKQYIDFEKIIDEEIAQEELSEIGEGSFDEGDVPFPSLVSLDDLIEDTHDEEFTIAEEHIELPMTAHADSVNIEDKKDDSKPEALHTIENVDELIDEELEPEDDKLKESEFDPSMTYIQKRIKDVIFNEVLSEEDSKNRLKPINNPPPVQTSDTQEPKKDSKPKISSPKFEAINLDDE